MSKNNSVNSNKISIGSWIVDFLNNNNMFMYAITFYEVQNYVMHNFIDFETSRHYNLYSLQNSSALILHHNIT